MLLLILATAARAEPKTLYSEVFAGLRSAEFDLGILERLASSQNAYNVRDWDRTTQALARLEAVWAQSRLRLDEASPPKHQELWEKTSRMLTLQQGLATRCAYVVQSEFRPDGASEVTDPQSLKRAKDEIEQLRAAYSQVCSELSRRL